MQTLTPRMLREMADRLTELADLWEGPKPKRKHGATCDVCGDQTFIVRHFGQECRSWKRDGDTIRSCRGTYRCDECPSFERVTDDLDRQAAARLTPEQIAEAAMHQAARDAFTEAHQLGSDLFAPDEWEAYHLPAGVPADPIGVISDGEAS